MQKELILEYKDDELQGIIIKEDKNYLTLKLNSGYNVILKKSEIKILSEKIIELNKKEKIRTEVNTKLTKIAIFHTGGTIASKVDYKTGAVSSKFTPEELLDLYKELNDIAQIKTKMIANLSSEDMNFKHYNLLLDEIKNTSDVEGIIITHGTDTMHYTACALQYALKNLAIPILLVGAQRSSDRPSSDGFGNLKAAVEFIIENSKLEQSYRRVGICMHNSSQDDNSFSILDSINARKMHSSRRDAFRQINYEVFALFENAKINILRKNLISKKPKEKLDIIRYDENLKIGFFKSHPNLSHVEINNLSIYDGVVVEGTGLGHLPVSKFDEYTKENPRNLKAIIELMRKTKIVIGVQTVYGITNMNIYSSGRHLVKTGILGNQMNLTTETLFVRLGYCLSQKEKSFEDSWGENLEGFECRSIDIDSEF